MTLTIKDNLNIKNRRIGQSGVTLVELLIVIAIMSVVMGVIFSFHLFGTKIFNKGVTQADIQSSLRLSSDFIIKEVRNATEITLSTPANPGDYYQIYASGNKLKYKAPGGTEVDKTGAIINNPSTDLLFSLVKIDSNYTLNFSMLGTSKESLYDLVSEVMLNNIKTASLLTNSQNIYYKKGTAIIPGPGGSGGSGGSGGGGSGSVTPVAITLDDITITAPIQGQNAQTTVDSAQFTGNVSWNPSVDNGKFKNKTIYTAKITLTPKAGFTISGIAQNFFKVPGATTVNNDANSVLVTAVFPET